MNAQNLLDLLLAMQKGGEILNELEIKLVFEGEEYDIDDVQSTENVVHLFAGP